MTTFHDLLLTSAERYGTRTAVLFEDQRLSYEDLLARAQALARGLAAQGIGARGRLAIIMDNSIECIVAWLAASLTGCTEIPINPQYRGELLAYLLADSGADAVVCDAGYLAQVAEVAGRLPALKLAHLGEAFGVRTAWHGPGDTSPVGMAANVHLDIAMHNFGIQEWAGRSEAEYEIFPGLPRPEQGYVYPNDKPGLGIEFNEKLAAKYPCTDENPQWTVSRLPDGTLWRP